MTKHTGLPALGTYTTVYLHAPDCLSPIEMAGSPNGVFLIGADKWPFLIVSKEPIHIFKGIAELNLRI